MELSGINRLLTLSKDLGVREVGESSRPGKPQSGRSIDSTLPSQERSLDPGLKVSLSQAAVHRLTQDLNSTTDAVSVAASTGIENPTSDIRLAASRDQAPRGRAFSAYQRNANDSSGERIRVRA